MVDKIQFSEWNLFAQIFLSVFWFDTMCECQGSQNIRVFDFSLLFNIKARECKSTHYFKMKITHLCRHRSFSANWPRKAKEVWIFRILWPPYCQYALGTVTSSAGEKCLSNRGGVDLIFFIIRLAHMINGVSHLFFQSVLENFSFLLCMKRKQLYLFCMILSHYIWWF